MIKKSLLCLFLFLLMGCAGDRLSFHQAGSATVNENRICISSFPGDILEYYSLSSSENNFEAPLSIEDNIVKKHSDTCIPLTLKYELNGKKYQFEFMTDAHKKVTITYSKS